MEVATDLVVAVVVAAAVAVVDTQMKIVAKC